MYVGGFLWVCVYQKRTKQRSLFKVFRFLCLDVCKRACLLLNVVDELFNSSYGLLKQKTNFLLYDRPVMYICR